MAEKSILKSGTYEFILGAWGQTKDHEIADGFGKKNVSCYKQDWVAVDVSNEDFEVFEPSSTAMLSFYGLIDPENEKGEGIEKGGGKIGFDQPRPWSDFMDLFRVSGADPDQMGKAVYPTGVKPGRIRAEVKAIPGTGNFSPKNVMVSWQNIEKAKVAVSVFKRALAADAPKSDMTVPKENPMKKAKQA